MSKAYNYMVNQAGPERRLNLNLNQSNSGGETENNEMRPLDPSTSSYTIKSSNSPSSTVSKIIERLKSTKVWDDRLKFARNRKERRKNRSQFAVNVPTRLIFHLIIVFFLIPLTLGVALLIRALFFGLKEDDAHPLHKKLPKSHLKKASAATATTVDFTSSEGDDASADASADVSADATADVDDFVEYHKQSTNRSKTISELISLNATETMDQNYTFNRPAIELVDEEDETSTNSSLVVSSILMDNSTSTASSYNSTQDLN